MAILKPISAVLTQAGVIKQQENTSRVSEILNDQGLTLEAAAESLRELTGSPESSVRLKSVEMAFKLHGALKEAENPSVPVINFTLQGDNNRLLTILTPRQ